MFGVCKNEDVHPTFAGATDEFDIFSINNFWGNIVVARRTAFVSSIAIGTLFFGGIQTVAVQADVIISEHNADSAWFALRIIDPSENVLIPDLLDLAKSKNFEVQTISFSGEQGVGQIEVIPGEPTDVLAARTTELFRSANTEVPALVGAVVSAPIDQAPGEVEANGFIVDLQPVSEELAFTPSLPIGEPASTSDAEPRSMSLTLAPAPAPAPAAATAVATAAGPNDWPAYFPGDWRNEARNMTRCTYYANQRCWSSVQRSNLIQSITWTGTAGTSVPWSFNDWGFEYGATLSNPAMCSTSTSYQGWWLGGNYSEWSTSVPESAGPYVEGNRLFDDCDKMSHEVGIRDPQMLIQGYQYTFSLNSPRNSAQASTKLSAHYQVLHDDCTLGIALTDCMGLNTNITWPYSTVQSTVVVNSTRKFTVPGCARMYRNWLAPIQWANGSSRLLSSPLGYYDTCLSNDY